jgi:hypothetical protein
MPNENFGHPLFHRKRTKPNGDTEEILLGPCAIKILRLIVALLITIILVLAGVKIPYSMHLLKALF